MTYTLTKFKTSLSKKSVQNKNGLLMNTKSLGVGIDKFDFKDYT